MLICSSLIITPYFLRTVYLTFMPVFAKESAKFLLGPVEIGIAVSAMGVAGFFSPFMFSELATRIDEKNVIVLGMGLEVLAFILLPIISGFPALLLTAVLLGLGGAAISPCMMAFLISKFRFSNRGLAIGVYGAAEDIGVLTGPLVAGFLYQDYGARSSFHFAAVLMATNGVLALPLLKKALQ